MVFTGLVCALYYWKMMLSWTFANQSTSESVCSTHNQCVYFHSVNQIVPTQLQLCFQVYSIGFLLHFSISDFTYNIWGRNFLLRCWFNCISKNDVLVSLYHIYHACSLCWLNKGTKEAPKMQFSTRLLFSECVSNNSYNTVCFTKNVSHWISFLNIRHKRSVRNNITQSFFLCDIGSSSWWAQPHAMHP